jgi:hypothetical protein
MWVYVGDAAHPYNVFDFTLSRGRDGPKYFLKDYNQVLLADGYGGYNGVVAGNGIERAGCNGRQALWTAVWVTWLADAHELLMRICHGNFRKGRHWGWARGGGAAILTSVVRHE